MFCPNCGSEIRKGSILCTECGTDVEEVKERVVVDNNKEEISSGEECIICSKCGNKAIKDSKLCNKCGKVL